VYPAHLNGGYDLKSLENTQFKPNRQQGITFPSARRQEYLLIVRLNIARPGIENSHAVKRGLRRLCALFESIQKGVKKVDVLSANGDLIRRPIIEFGFSATIGFGVGFFERLSIKKQNTPRKLREMPDHSWLGDPIPYDLAQTDMVLQLGSEKDFVNRWVLENTFYPDEEEHGIKSSITYSPGSQEPSSIVDKNYEDIVSNAKGWAIITDIHSGFQRLDGRNLMGFNDGISNPNGRLRDSIVWLSPEDEGQKFKDGTYMVFQKIEHDLDQWRALSVTEQERWVGRSKGTGLLLGTLSQQEDKKLGSDLRSDDSAVRTLALTKLGKLLSEQRDPEKKFYDDSNLRFRNIQIECPVWSHVRKANPREADNVGRRFIFRRGYLYMDSNMNGKTTSGLLFICFQRDIANGFEYIKRNLLNNKKFPVPEVRKNFNKYELQERLGHEHFSRDEAKQYRFDVVGFMNSTRDQTYSDIQTGREGLAGPSQLGLTPQGNFIATYPIGGGYYFIPPAPHGHLSEIADLFFE
jgi:Dyp-type peroxidase family